MNDNNRSIRDQVLKNLMTKDFTSDQLKIVDMAMLKVLKDFNFSPAETHLALQESCVPEIMQYSCQSRALFHTYLKRR